MDAPAWPDRRLFPFAPHAYVTCHGRMHHVDEGAGETLVFLHGHLGWSFSWRRAIQLLSPRFRCLAPDLIGFGLSEKPAEGLTAAEHAKLVAGFLDAKGVRGATLVAHEAGVPVAMAVELARPGTFTRLVLCNGTIGSPDPGSPAEKAAKAAAGVLGALAYTKANPGKLVRPLFCDKTVLSDAAALAYAGPFEDKAKRAGPRSLASAPVKEARWLEHLWHERETLLCRPTVLYWGLKDHILDTRVLDHLWHANPVAEVERVETAGSFAFEERPEAFAAAVERLATGALDTSQAIRMV